MLKQLYTKVGDEYIELKPLEELLNWLIARAKEKSTWAGIAGAAATILHIYGITVDSQQLTYIISTLVGILIVTPEAKA